MYSQAEFNYSIIGLFCVNCGLTFMVDQEQTKFCLGWIFIYISAHPWSRSPRRTALIAYIVTATVKQWAVNRK